MGIVPSRDEMATLGLVSVGVAVFVYEGFTYSRFGISLTAISIVLQCTQISLSGRLMQGAKLDALQMTFYTSPVACLVLLPLAIWFEGPTLAKALTEEPVVVTGFLLVSSSMALGYNIVLFQSLSTFSPVTTAVLGNFKIVILLLLTAVFFGELGSWSGTQKLGCFATISGSYAYSRRRLKK